MDEKGLMEEDGHSQKDELEFLLDGDLSTYSLYRWSVVLLLGGGWFYAGEAFLDAFISHPVSVEDCFCSSPIAMGSMSLENACSACAASAPGAMLQCSGDETTIATTFGLYCDSDWMRSISPTAFFAGTALGSLSGGLADKIGRRPVFVISRSLSAVIFFATAIVPNLPLYMLAKAAIGFTTTIGTLASYPLAVELVGAKLRTRLTIEIWCYVWAISCCYLSLQEYILRKNSWRIHVLASAVPYALLAIGYALVIPESPYYHLQNGRWPEARAVAMRLVGLEQTRLVVRRGSRAVPGPAEPSVAGTMRSKGFPDEVHMAQELGPSSDVGVPAAESHLQVPAHQVELGEACGCVESIPQAGDGQRGDHEGGPTAMNPGKGTSGTVGDGSEAFGAKPSVASTTGSSGGSQSAEKATTPPAVLAAMQSSTPGKESLGSSGQAKAVWRIPLLELFSTRGSARATLIQVRPPMPIPAASTPPPQTHPSPVTLSPLTP